MCCVGVIERTSFCLNYICSFFRVFLYMSSKGPPPPECCVSQMKDGEPLPCGEDLTRFPSYVLMRAALHFGGDVNMKVRSEAVADRLRNGESFEDCDLYACGKHRVRMMRLAKAKRKKKKRKNETCGTCGASKYLLIASEAITTSLGLGAGIYLCKGCRNKYTPSPTVKRRRRCFGSPWEFNASVVMPRKPFRHDNPRVRTVRRALSSIDAAVDRVGQDERGKREVRAALIERWGVTNKELERAISSKVKRRKPKSKELVKYIEDTKRGQAVVKKVIARKFKDIEKKATLSGACTRLHNDLSRERNNNISKSSFATYDEASKEIIHAGVFGVPLPKPLNSVYHQEKALKEEPMRKCFVGVDQMNKITEDNVLGVYRPLEPVLVARLKLFQRHKEIITDKIKPIKEIHDGELRHVVKWYGDGIAGGDMGISLIFKTEELTHTPMLVDNVCCGRFSEKDSCTDKMLDFYDHELEKIEKYGIDVDGVRHYFYFEPQGDIPYLTAYSGQASSNSTFGNPFLELSPEHKLLPVVGVTNQEDGSFKLPFDRQHAANKLKLEAELKKELSDDEYWELTIGGIPVAVKKITHANRLKRYAAVQAKVEERVEGLLRMSTKMNELLRMQRSVHPPAVHNMLMRIDAGRNASKAEVESAKAKWKKLKKEQKLPWYNSGGCDLMVKRSDENKIVLKVGVRNTRKRKFALEEAKKLRSACIKKPHFGSDRSKVCILHTLLINCTVITLHHLAIRRMHRSFIDRCVVSSRSLRLNMDTGCPSSKSSTSGDTRLKNSHHACQRSLVLKTCAKEWKRKG